MTDPEREVLRDLRDAVDSAIEALPPESACLSPLIKFAGGIETRLGERSTAASVRGERLRQARRRQRPGRRPNHLRSVETS